MKFIIICKIWIILCWIKTPLHFVDQFVYINKDLRYVCSHFVIFLENGRMCVCIVCCCFLYRPNKHRGGEFEENFSTGFSFAEYSSNTFTAAVVLLHRSIVLDKISNKRHNKRKPQGHLLKWVLYIIEL